MKIDREELFAAAERAGVKLIPAVYDKDGRKVTMVYTDGTYSCVDPRFDLSYYDEDKTNEKVKRENEQ
ncbi:hypothetical protein [Companilactobacillus hulinensis]|uniref:hypothetical protein n=1 Tax=Companilactobacillus hulinensis TaxID=2486007 RepID=UPI000F78C98A|nr:hypothetical protein [Companilactobacillus hulinensis]